MRACFKEVQLDKTLSVKFLRDLHVGEYVDKVPNSKGMSLDKNGTPRSGEKPRYFSKEVKPDEKRKFRTTRGMADCVGEFGGKIQRAEVPDLHTCIGVLVAALDPNKKGLREFAAFHCGDQHTFDEGFFKSHELVLKSELTKWREDNEARKIVLVAAAGASHSSSLETFKTRIQKPAEGQIKTVDYVVILCRSDPKPQSNPDRDRVSVLTVLSEGTAYVRHHSEL